MSKSQDEIVKKSVNAIAILIVIIIILIFIICYLIIPRAKKEIPPEKKSVMTCGTPNSPDYVESNINATHIYKANCAACHHYTRYLVARPLKLIVDELPEPKLKNFIDYVHNPAKAHKENRSAHIKKIEAFIGPRGIEMMPPFELSDEELTALYNSIINQAY